MSDYDSQDELKTGARKKTWAVGYHEKYMNGSNTGIFKKNGVCSSTHPHENSGATSISNVSDEFRERRTGAPEFMADRIIL